MPEPPFNPFRIDWNTASADQWDALVAECPRSTLPQTWQYAMAEIATGGGRADFGVIRFHAKPIGLVMVRIRPLLGPIGVYAIHRGPIWIYGEIPGAMQKLVMTMVRRRYHIWKGKALVFHPELADTDKHRAAMKQCGFARRREGYESAWLDLTPPLEALRSGLKQNWRTSLNKAGRAGLTIVADPDGAELDWLLDQYAADKAARGYRGPSPALVRHLRDAGGAAGSALTGAGAHRHGGTLRLYCADHDGRRIAGVCLALHGQCATYLIGWTDAEGRQANAHHLLLWRAVEDLKQAGITALDLGGFNEDDAAGIKRFKLGMGADAFQLVGGYV